VSQTLGQLWDSVGRRLKSLTLEMSQKMGQRWDTGTVVKKCWDSSTQCCPTLGRTHFFLVAKARVLSTFGILKDLTLDTLDSGTKE
jgi:hypothetical protein